MALEWLFGRSRGQRRGTPRGVRSEGGGSRDARGRAEAETDPMPSVLPTPARWSQILEPPVESAQAMRAPAPEAYPDDPGRTRVVGAPGARSRSVKAVLVGVEGVLEGEIFAVRQGENRMGRRADLEISLPQRDDQISREHAVLICDEGSFGIKPLKTTNPTSVNGDVVAEGAPLSDGDEISVGRSTFRLKIV